MVAGKRIGDRKDGQVQISQVRGKQTRAAASCSPLGRVYVVTATNNRKQMGKQQQADPGPHFGTPERLSADWHRLSCVRSHVRTGRFGSDEARLPERGRSLIDRVGDARIPE